MVKIRHKITYVNDGEALVRGHNRALKNAFTASAELGKRRFVPARFSSVGSRDLPYRRRSRKYVAKKRRQKGHNHPFVWSGESKRRALAGRTARGSKNKITITIPFDSSIMRFLKKWGYDVRAEIGTLSPRELNHLAENTASVLEVEIAKRRPKRTERV